MMPLVSRLSNASVARTKTVWRSTNENFQSGRPEYHMHVSFFVQAWPDRTNSKEGYPGRNMRLPNNDKKQGLDVTALLRGTRWLPSRSR
jgi:hypothetical protein